MGQLLVLSLANGDLPVILGIVLVVSIVVVIANLVVDILYSVLDPRIRLHGSGDSVQASRRVVRQLRTQPQQAPSPRRLREPLGPRLLVVRAGACADHRPARLAALEEDRGRDREHLVARGGLQVLVDVELGELDAAVVLGLELGEDRLDRAARARTTGPRSRPRPGSRTAGPPARRSRRSARARFDSTGGPLAPGAAGRAPSRSPRARSGGSSSSRRARGRRR